MKLNGKVVDLQVLGAELEAADIPILGLGTVGDDVFTYDEDGAPAELPAEAVPVVDAHVAPPKFVEYAGARTVAAIARTSDAATTEVFRFPTEPKHVYRATLRMTAIDAGSNATRDAEVRLVFKRPSATITQVGTTTVLSNVQDPAAAAWQITPSVAGTDLVISVDGGRRAYDRLGALRRGRRVRAVRDRGLDMPWSAPVSPTPGTTILAAYATANIVNPILWLRLMTGAADPPGTGYMVTSDSAAATTWKTGIAAIGAVLGYTPVNKAGDTGIGDLTSTGTISALGLVAGANGIVAGAGGITTTGPFAPASYAGGSTAAGTPSVLGLNVGTSGVASTGPFAPASYAGGSTAAGTPSGQGSDCWHGRDRLRRPRHRQWHHHRARAARRDRCVCHGGRPDGGRRELDATHRARRPPPGRGWHHVQPDIRGSHELRGELDPIERAVGGNRPRAHGQPDDPRQHRRHDLSSDGDAYASGADAQRREHRLAPTDESGSLGSEDLAMADRRTIEGWGAILNVPGEPLAMDQAMLLNLGHMNARLEVAVTALQDMQARLTRIELFLKATIPGYDDQARQAVFALAEGARATGPEG
jgi:hypothetical protein